MGKEGEEIICTHNKEPDAETGEKFCLMDPDCLNCLRCKCSVVKVNPIILDKKAVEYFDLEWSFGICMSCNAWILCRQAKKQNSSVN